MNFSSKSGLGILSVAIVGIVIIIAIFGFQGEKEDNSVEAKKIFKADFSPYISAEGVVEALESEDIYFDASAQVENILVNKFQKVVAGDKLLIFDNDKTKLSPINGFVSQINVKKGSRVPAGFIGITIVNTDKIQIKAQLKERDYPKVQDKMQVKISTGIDNSNVVLGKVKAVSPFVTRKKTGNVEETFVECVIEPEKMGNVLKPGANVNCDIFTSAKRKAVTVSYSMIREIEGNKYVMVSDDTGKLTQRKIKTGESAGFLVEVLEGLKGDELVITNPKLNFVDGTKVKLVTTEAK